jgi:polyhydroxybutyrate depolymerase
LIRRLLVLVLLAGLLVVPSGFTISTVLLRIDGLTRSYLVVEPVRRTEKMPVLVELHGCCTTPWVELDRSGFIEATSEQAILVYPSGYQEVWNAGACCGSTNVDDVSFISDVVSRVLASTPEADPSHVFLAGYSNGGRMAYRMACERPGLFAAVAVFGAVSAVDCPSVAPIPILIAAGVDDPELVVPEFGIPHVVHGFIECSVTGEALLYAAANGWADVSLVLYPGGHEWPAGLAAVMWRFFTGRTGP